MIEEAQIRRITINDFRMWLEGVEEMQSENWVPDARQWQRIREKIDSIEDTPVQAPPRIPSGPIPRSAAFVQEQAPIQPPAGPAVPAGPSLMSPNFAVGAPNSPAQLTGPFATNSQQIPVRTPNIDTAGGKPYESSFA